MRSRYRKPGARMNVIEPLEDRRMLAAAGFGTDGWSEVTFGPKVGLSPGAAVRQADGKLLVLLSI